MTREYASSYECVDPSVGDEIWQLDDPALDADLRRRLEAHVSVCHACRMDRDLDARARRLVKDGELGIEELEVLVPENDETPTPPSIRPFAARAVGYAASLAIAASLAGILLLPPRPVGADVAIRGDDATRFTRPVEGEVVPASGCRLSWTAVDGAARYEVRVTGRDGDLDWVGTTERLQLDLPDDVVLTDGDGYKAVLAVQPADLLPPGRASVDFRAGSWIDITAHRLRRARIWAQGVGLAGLALLGLALVRRRG